MSVVDQYDVCRSAEERQRPTGRFTCPKKQWHAYLLCFFLGIVDTYKSIEWSEHLIGLSLLLLSSAESTEEP